MSIKIPVRLPPAAAGCGDYQAWLDYEAREAVRERQAEREARFCPDDGAVPVGTEPAELPWAAERRRRVAIAQRLVETTELRGVELDNEIDRLVDKRTSTGT